VIRPLRKFFTNETDSACAWEREVPFFREAERESWEEAMEKEARSRAALRGTPAAVVRPLNLTVKESELIV